MGGGKKKKAKKLQKERGGRREVASSSHGQSALTDPKLRLFSILLQVNLDAGFEEVQLGLELLGHGGHGVLHLGQAAVIPKEIHPAIRR